MLNAPEGVSFADLCAATSWQAHSVRAALSGLRKSGSNILRLPKPEGGSGPLYQTLFADKAAR